MLELNLPEFTVKRFVVFGVPVKHWQLVAIESFQHCLYGLFLLGVGDDAEILFTDHSNGLIIATLRKLANNDIWVDVLHFQVLVFVRAFALQRECLLFLEGLEELQDKKEWFICVWILLAIERSYSHQVHTINKLEEIPHDVWFQSFVDLLNQRV